MYVIKLYLAYKLICF